MEKTQKNPVIFQFSISRYSFLHRPQISMLYMLGMKLFYK